MNQQAGDRQAGESRPGGGGRRSSFWLGLLVGLVAGVAGTILFGTLAEQWPRRPSPVRLAPRPGSARPWAAPLSRPGLSNLFRVSEDLYRGARPAEQGYAELKKLGIRTVINLQSFHGESADVRAADLDYEHIHTKTWHFEDEDVVRFLKIVSDRSQAPFFVHCYHGSDRTGAMAAIYRIVLQNWSKQEAIDEMTRGGFGWHANFENLITYIRDLDVEKLKRLAAVAGASQPDTPAQPAARRQR